MFCVVKKRGSGWLAFSGECFETSSGLVACSFASLARSCSVRTTRVGE